MNAEQKCLIVFIGLMACCMTVLYAFLFLALWPYREYVGASLLGLLIFSIVLWRIVEARGKLNEQELRQVRYRHHEETPLDWQGEPCYWPQGAQPNPYRHTPPYYYQPYQSTPAQYQSYLTQERNG